MTIKDTPCKDCDRKGCGSYHDECEQFQEWKEGQRKRSDTIKDGKKWKGRSYIKESTYRSRVRESKKRG